MFVATWDRVEAFSGIGGRVNTFQAVILSNGTLTFVRFNYGDIQWGGSTTLIGVSVGNRFNFITHPASLSSSVLSLDNTTATYRVDSKLVIILYMYMLHLKNTTSPPISGECSDGEIRTDFVNISRGQFRQFEGTFDICAGGLFGRVCDIGWNQLAAQAVCRREFGDGFGKRH